MYPEMGNVVGMRVAELQVFAKNAGVLRKEIAVTDKQVTDNFDIEHHDSGDIDAENV